MESDPGYIANLFLSTPSARRATADRMVPPPAETYFYPRPPRGGRQWSAKDCSTATGDFYPRPPRGGRLHLRWPEPEHQQFLSTPSARRATQGSGLCSQAGQISIHALREEGDPLRSRSDRRSFNFYPRPPRGGRLVCMI